MVAAQLLNINIPVKKAFTPLVTLDNFNKDNEPHRYCKHLPVRQ